MSNNLFKIKLTESAWKELLGVPHDRRRKTILKTMVNIMVAPLCDVYKKPDAENEYFRYSSAHEILYSVDVENEVCVVKVIRWRDRMY